MRCRSRRTARSTGGRCAGRPTGPTGRMAEVDQKPTQGLADDMRELQIAGRRVADDTDAYVVAEVGHNHGGDLKAAEELVRRAAESGADAVKLQKRDNRT